MLQCTVHGNDDPELIWCILPSAWWWMVSLNAFGALWQCALLRMVRNIGARCTMLLAIFGALSGFQHHRCNYWIVYALVRHFPNRISCMFGTAPFQVKSFSFIDYWFLGAKLKMQSLKARKKTEQISSEWQNCRQYSWSSNLHLICKKIAPCMP